MGFSAARRPSSRGAGKGCGGALGEGGVPNAFNKLKRLH